MEIISYLFTPKKQQISSNEFSNHENLESIRAAFKEGDFTRLISLIKTSTPSPEIMFYQAVILENNLGEESPFIENLRIVINNPASTEKVIEDTVKAAIGGDKTYQNSIFKKLNKDVEEIASHEYFQDEDKEIFLNKVDKLLKKEASKRLYQESYKKGFLQAGNSLARIYQKEGKEADAEIIYYEIILNSGGSDNAESDKAAKSYATYRINRIKEAKIFHQFKDSTSTKKLIDSYQVITKDPQISDTLKQKTLYHAALLKLEMLEEAKKLEITNWYSEELSKINSSRTATPEQKKNFRKFLDKDFEKKIDEIPKTINTQKLREIKKLLEESSNLGYKPAAAELANIEARELLSQGKYKEAIRKCKDEALDHHAKNINARLISARAYEKLADDKWDGEKYDAASDLIKEVLARAPENKQALAQQKSLTDKAVEEITERVVKNLSEKAEEFVPEYSYIVGPTIAEIAEIKKRKTAYIESLHHKIKSSLIEKEYIQNHINFAGIERISSAITEIIFHENHSNFERIIKNNEEEIKLKIKDRIDKGITTYCNIQSKEFTKDVSINDQELIKNREIFKKEIVKKLLDYHQRCTALTGPESDLQIKLNTTGFDVTQLAFPLAGFLGPNNGGVALGVGAFAVKVIKDIGEKWYRQGLYDTAKKFASIGEVNDKRDADHYSNAKQAFEYVAEELVRSYGMQLDNIDGDKAIEELANAATEKMLNHLSNNTSTMKKFRQFAQRPFASVISNISSKLSNVKQDTRDYIAEMLEGVIKGESTDGKKTIKTKDAATWQADAIFENPAVTIDGENIYYNDKSDAKTYGARYCEFIPTTHNKVNVENNAKKRIEEKLQKHLHILEISDTRTTKAKIEHHKDRTEITQTQYAKDRRKARINFIAGLTKASFGAASAYTAALYGVSASLGFHPAIIGVTAATLGVSVSIVAPVIIWTLAVVGVGLLIKGAIDLVKASDKIELLEKKHIITAEEANARIAKKIHIKENIRQQADISEKIKTKARYAGNIKIKHEVENPKNLFLDKKVMKSWMGLRSTKKDSIIVKG